MSYRYFGHSERPRVLNDSYVVDPRALRVSPNDMNDFRGRPQRESIEDYAPRDSRPLIDTRYRSGPPHIVREFESLPLLRTIADIMFHQAASGS